MKKLVAPVVAAAAFTLGALSLSTVAQAQYGRGNPLEDFLRGLENRRGDSNLNCRVQHQLDRRGDIRWLSIDCRGYRGGR